MVVLEGVSRVHQALQQLQGGEEGGRRSCRWVGGGELMSGKVGRKGGKGELMGID